MIVLTTGRNRNVDGYNHYFFSNILQGKIPYFISESMFKPFLFLLYIVIILNFLEAWDFSLESLSESKYFQNLPKLLFFCGKKKRKGGLGMNGLGEN